MMSNYFLQFAIFLHYPIRHWNTKASALEFPFVYFTIGRKHVRMFSCQ